MQTRIREQWFSNVKNDVLSGMTVGFALIPEAIAFSMIAGVDPMVGLYAAFILAIVISFTGGRMGMISGATGSTALLMVSLVKEYGVQYLFAAAVLTGLLQILFGVMKLGRFITFVPQSVITGFVNALAILLFVAQLPHLRGANWMAYVMVAGTLVIIYGLPRFTKVVPSALVAIIVMTILSVVTGAHVQTVGQLGHMTSQLPSFHIPMVPFNLHTLQVILPFSLPIAVVGSMETLMTATIVDERTRTKSDKNRELRGLGIANLVCGFFGAMGGCAMIGQTVINVESGGRKRLSTFVSGAFLLILLVLLSAVVRIVPIAVLVGVMFMVSVNTFEWTSLRDLRKMNISEAITMILTVIIVVATDDLAIGVLVGVTISALVFGWRMANLRATTRIDEHNRKRYIIFGQMFFGTMAHFVNLFDIEHDPAEIIIDFSHSHIWDHSAVTGINKVIDLYVQAGGSVSIVGLNEESQRLIHKSGMKSFQT
ncbi:SulP family inorganic anion transporter [Alicyclobacillus fastidiosus]|uniref:SulP family inorganic anion transporter n=1 Tax=Alicyclobacillus fastidiosus TaxID=392011 RepID=A0ABY6ZRF8_9BACL|nr:SulP family inorganic anion transporter [Alicyclobacillus fastidiosus]WAH44751.1 SulP family inorganic anion transporter [Alicyclobacillus fastidiosus]